jgi:hypothetical protein
VLESNDPGFEFINYYGNTSHFALESIRRHAPLAEMNLLSIATLMPHLADYTAIFKRVYHNTMVETRCPFPIGGHATLQLLQRDLFELPPMDIDCIISHAAIHCFNDTRYGNVNTAEGYEKPYLAAKKLREIVGNRTVPAVVSIAVHREDGFFDNNTHLSHDRFVKSFESAGFTLRDHFFDYVCGGLPQRPEYLNPEFRRSKILPDVVESPRHWVAGNYYFA